METCGDESVLVGVAAKAARVPEWRAGVDSVPNAPQRPARAPSTLQRRGGHPGSGSAMPIL